jgi:hypothetical protein
MNFPANFPKENIMAWCGRQIDAITPIAAAGIEVEIRVAKKQRTYRQNKFFHAVLSEIARFVIRNGGWLDGMCLPAWAIGTESLKGYFKQKFGVVSTAKLSTKEFCDFIDGIQAHMQLETHGEYTPLIPEDGLIEWANQRSEI